MNQKQNTKKEKKNFKPLFVYSVTLFVGVVVYIYPTVTGHHQSLIVGQSAHFSFRYTVKPRLSNIIRSRRLFEK